MSVALRITVRGCNLMIRPRCSLIALAVICLTVGAWLCTSVFAQEGAGEMGIDRLHQQMMQQLAAVWTQLVQGVAQDPGFMETAAAEELLQRQEALMAIRWGMMEAMTGPERGAQEMGPAGTFQFVSWIELDSTYWALDTRTGQMHPRRCPEPPMDEEMAE